PADAGSGTICLNGPPARLFQPSDLVIILSLCEATDEEYNEIVSRVVHVDGNNRIVKIEAHALKDLNGFSNSRKEM
ncbi:MAG: aspartate 1-decarboxylase, partial [Bacilli bacterium]